MKTLKQIKEEVANEYGFDSYLEMIDYEDGFDICIIDEIANRYANEQLLLHGVVPMLLCNYTEKNWGITKDKKYIMINEDKSHFYIVNDHGKKDKIFKNYFDKIPNNN